MSRNRVIGRNGQLPWNLPDEMRHFVDATLGKPVIMGRKTFESMPAALTNRLNLVISRQSRVFPGATWCHSLNNALDHARTHCRQNLLQELFVIGGASIYADALPLADRLYQTIVHATIDGDTFFPEFDSDDWSVVQEDHHPCDERHRYAFDIQVLQRKVTT